MPLPTSRLAQVFLFQPQVQHYRLALWDGLVARGRGRYELSVYGPLEDGGAFGGGQRSYLHPTDEVLLAEGRFELRRSPDLPRLVKEHRPDVVVVSVNLRNLTHWNIRRSCRNVPVHWVAHAKVHSGGGLPPAVTNWLKKRFYRRFDVVVCYGERSRQELLALGYPSDMLRVARNTIDTTRIFTDGDAMRDRGRSLCVDAGVGDHPVVVCVGRMDPDKRQRDLIAAVDLVHADGVPCTLVLVGGGPDLDVLRAEQSAGTLSRHGQRVVLTGRVPEGDDYAWIAAADVCVFPGAVGLAVNQALALGVPTVIADEDGADGEIVEHEVTGWRYERGDIAALAQLIRSILADRHMTTAAGTDASAVASPVDVAGVCARAVALMRNEVSMERMVDVFDEAISG